MEKYDVVKDWEGIDFVLLEVLISSTNEYWMKKELRKIQHQIENLRDKQLKTFPKLERK